MSLGQNCKVTGSLFEISDAEQEAYDSFGLPYPSLSPAERSRLYLSFRSRLQFFWRQCDYSGKLIYSSYPETAPFPVVQNEFWASKDFDAIRYGIDFDLKRSFMEQLKTIWQQVPRPSCAVRASGEIRASHNVANVKDSFFIFDSYSSETCYYSTGLWNCQKCCDSLYLQDCRACYSCINCLDCSSLRWAEHCVSTHDSYFCSNLSNCSNCLFCANLEGKDYHVFNQKVSPDEFERRLAELNLTARQRLEAAQDTFEEFLRVQPTPGILASESTSVSGNYLRACEEVYESFECVNSRELINCCLLRDSKNCLAGYAGSANNSAQFISVWGTGIVNSINCWGDCQNLTYCSHCVDSSDLLGCVGLKGKQYCILNKQYTEKQYKSVFANVKKIMEELELWGLFFPSAFSGYSYNLSAAYDQMPLNQTQASMMRFPWEERDDVVKPSQLLGEVPPAERFSEVPMQLETCSDEEAHTKLYLCELSGRPFQITREELALYRELNVAPPARSFEMRAKVRMSRLTPTHLRVRKSDFSDKYITTAFPEAWRQPVYALEEWQESRQ